MAISPKEIQIGGTAPKWILRNEQDHSDLIIAKLGAKNGRIEVLTELFNNLLGDRLGFGMAQCGIARLDEHIYFLSRSFLQPGELLIQGSLMIEDVCAAEGETARVPHREEQSFYSLDFLHEVFRKFCGPSAEAVFSNFVDMLFFDALIGSTDRHAQNWGLVTTRERGLFRFAPIFDSAHALLWDLHSDKLRSIANEAGIQRYTRKAFPCVGPPVVPGRTGRRWNHFALIQEIVGFSPEAALTSMKKIGDAVPEVAAELLKEFPFARGFEALRKRLILRVLQSRALQVLASAQKRG
ncbi:MAG TPA: HipA domain-containing protein [Terriglobales bacterium]|nr:HipA domain-containing protein [Terriglobales bacterium]